MLTAYIQSIGVFAPGLIGWQNTADVLAGIKPYVAEKTPQLRPTILPSDVRRRTTDHIRLAIEVAAQAVTAAGVNAKNLVSVFASSENDGQNSHSICAEVVKETPAVSPTRFHNSVNNAPAGYWSMVSGSVMASTSIAALDATVAAGLIESCIQLNTENVDTLCVIHDTPLPTPLHQRRPINGLFGCAMVLSKHKSAQSLAQLTLGIESGKGNLTTMDNESLERVRLGNPAAGVLPLLTACAGRNDKDIWINYLKPSYLRVNVRPCT
jgi:hypothetical protein